MPISFRVRASLVEAPLLSASTNDRCGFRVDRLRPAISFRFLHDTSTPFRCRSVATRHLRSVTARGAPLHLRLQTIFTLPFPLYPRHLRLCLRRRVRSHSSLPRNLRLLFRPVRIQASALRPPIGALPPSATILPPIRGLMNARSLARGTRFICRRGQVCRRLRLSTPPGTWLLQWHLTAHSLSRSHPQSSPPPSIFGRGSVALRFG